MTAARLDRAQLADALAWVARAIPTRTNTPVLAGMRLTFTEGEIRAAGFDYETSHAARIPADVTETGEVLVSGHGAAAMIGALRGDQVELSPGGNGWGLTVKAGRSTYRLPELPLADYPDLPKPPPAVGSIGAGLLGSVIRTAAHALDRSGTLPMLTGVHLIGGTDGLTAWTTDRFRICRRSVEWRATGDLDAVVPGRQLATAIAGMEGRVDVGCDGSRIQLTTEARAVTIQLLQDDRGYPDLRRVVPDMNAATTRVDVDVLDLTEALSRSQLALEANESVVLVVKGDCIELDAALQPSGGFDEVVDADVSAGDTGEVLDRIAFNPTFLSDALKALGTSRALIGLTTPGRPAVLTPIGTGNPDRDPDIHTVVMPRKLT